MKKIIISLLIVMCFTTIVKAQNEKYIGVNFAVDKNFNGQASNYTWQNSTNVGLFFEHQFAKHWSYDFGANIRNTYYPDKKFAIKIQSVIVPVSLKFVSNAINIGLTGYADLYLSWKDLTDNVGSVQIGTYDAEKYNVGGYLTISKSIIVTRGLYVEPYIMGGTNMYSDIIVALGVKLKMGFR